MCVCVCVCVFVCVREREWESEETQTMKKCVIFNPSTKVHAFFTLNLATLQLKEKNQAWSPIINR